MKIRPAVLLSLLIAAAVACSKPDRPKVESSYDKATGKLKLLTADQNKDGKVDTWIYMDGAKPLRTEQDLDGDGKIERWEFLRPDGSATEIAVSRRKTGQPDMWTYYDASGDATKIETASTDGTAGQPARADRTEFYTAGKLVRVEEDTDGDGRVDKWEQHDGPLVTSVEFDYDKDGKPDERIVFASDGRVTARQKLGTAGK